MKDTRWDEVKSYLRPPYGWVLLLSVGSFLQYLSLLYGISPVVFESIPTSEQIFWFRGMAITLFGSYLVAALIDRTYRKIEERERKRAMNIALEQLAGPVNTQMTLFSDWYVASIADEPTPRPHSHRVLLEGDYYERVRWLDFSKEYQSVDSNNVTWFDISARQLEDSQETIESVLSKYSPFMDSEMISDFEQLSNSTLTDVVIALGKRNLPKFDEEKGVERDYTMFMGKNMEKYTNEHVDALLKILTYYENSETPDLTSMDDAGVWRDDYRANVGEARSDIHPEESNPKFGTGSGAPPREGLN